MVLYPGHPLVGRTVRVVRRYGRREDGQWVIELPDGSRQYVPTSWCAPLTPAEGTDSMSAPSPKDPPPSSPTSSPLSLAALRDLAALVCRLQEDAIRRAEEQHDGPHGRNEGAPRGRARPPGGRADDPTGVTDVGELCGGGSRAGGTGNPARGPAPGGEPGGPPAPGTRRQP